MRTPVYVQNYSKHVVYSDSPPDEKFCVIELMFRFLEPLSSSHSACPLCSYTVNIDGFSLFNEAAL